MNQRKAILLILFIIALLSGGAWLQVDSAHANTSSPTENHSNISKVNWDAYYYGEMPAGETSDQWQPFSTINSAQSDASSGQDLWLRASLVEADQQTAQQLLVYYYVVKPYEISLYMDGTPIFTSQKLLPSGFISWRIVPYATAEGEGNPILLARISPHQNLENGFEIWSGTASEISLKLLRTEAPIWGGAIVLALLGVISLLLFAFNRSQILFIYFAIFSLSISIDLSVLWGGWQFAFKPEKLMLWGSLIHLNWYLGHASGILITHAIAGAKNSKWLRNIGFGVIIYACAALIAWLLFGEEAQLLFYRFFYNYISIGILTCSTFVLIRALLRRRDTEITIFAIGNALFIGGIVIGRLVSGQIWLFPSKQALLTSYHAIAQIGWTFIGFIGVGSCLAIIMAMRLFHLTRVRATNAQLKLANNDLLNVNAKLSRIDEIRSNMYSEVSHELNTPITAIKGYVQLMLKGTIPMGEPRYLNVIHAKTLVMERMIDDMLEIARLENKHIAFEYELLPFSAFFTRLCGKVQLEMQEHGFEFKWISPNETWGAESIMVFNADPMRVEQVFHNMLSNARKFTPVGGSIVVEASYQAAGQAEQAVTIRFSDTGCGIPLEEQEQIFERYFRGGASKTAAITGTGLGLSICRQIMSAHQGEIGLERSSASGSTFYIRFPLRLMQAQELELEPN